jgi:dethiobiotin synthetase
MTKSYFVTGTDTEVGKTFVSAAILNACKRAGYSCSAMKPIASGCEWKDGELRNADALTLMEQATVAIPYKEVNPFAFEPAIAPHIAAAQAKQQIALPDLLTHTKKFMSYEADLKLIEGAGGWRVPLSEESDFSDYAKALGLPVLLVVSIRLGCINHALLSAESIRAKGLVVAGWFANRVSAGAEGENEAQKEVTQQNIDSIAERIEAPLLATLPYFEEESFKEERFEEESFNSESDAHKIQSAADVLLANNINALFE